MLLFSVATMRAVPILFLGFFLIATNVSISSCCVESERRALLSFKQGLKDPSNRLSSWDTVKDVDCCKWAGVVCKNLTGHVRELHLQNPYYEDFTKPPLGGEVSPSLLNLKHLSYLDLSQNDFGGVPIPSFLGSLVSLQYLNLSEAGFTGTVPHQLGNLSSIRFLSLKGPWPYPIYEGPGPYLPVFKLDVENLDWLSGLSTLEHLDLSHVSLKKATNWLQVINLLPSLVELHLSRCELDRIPPLSRVNFTSLAVLDLSLNGGFYSSIPRWIFSLGYLVSLNLRSNQFAGPIPDLFWNLTSLRVLDVSDNLLNFPLPNSLFTMNGLVSLNLRNIYGYGFFGGPIPRSPIPRGLLNMTSLRDLDLSYTGYNSSIPDWIYSFRHLELLNLGGNQLQGVISSSIENLTSLVTLDLSSNELKGRVTRELGNLCNLRRLDLSSNKFGEDISKLFEILSICNSYALEYLSLGGYQLSGHLTEQLGQFESLKVLYLGVNSISGPIPVSIGRCLSLEVLDLEGNQLSGTIPESLGHLSKLAYLGIGYNLLQGVVSEVHFANLTSLTTLHASGNQLVLNVSPNWIPPFQLTNLLLRNVQLGPRFPMWLYSQEDFLDLDLSCTGISDSAPHWFWNLSSRFQYLNLSHNQIQGEIPNILQLDTIFSMIYLGSNNFSGPLPRLSSNVTELDLSNNAFSGDIFHFLCDGKDKPNQLEILHLGENLLSGEIPDCWRNWPALKVIKLGNNNLSGNIPGSLGYLKQLESLHLRNNSLSGEIPSNLENCTELLTIDLGWNHFAGSVPKWLGRSFSKLMILGLRSNNFYGKITSELCHLTSLRILDLANNSFSGSIPRCFKNFTALAVQQNSSDPISYSFYLGEFLENAFVVTKGREVQYNTILTLATSMDLSDNNISGEIPRELMSLLKLRSLNLSGNHLTGVIPKEIGNMETLESLDFSRNQLSGEIPPTISNLTFLNYLNVSFNNLSGRIPSSTQLQSLPASSFIGNKLCGPPLTRNCSIPGATPDIKKGDHEEVGAKSEVDWFYVTMALGFVVGFWGICGSLLFKKTWRYAYFKFLDNTWDRICVCIAKY